MEPVDVKDLCPCPICLVVLRYMTTDIQRTSWTEQGHVGGHAHEHVTWLGLELRLILGLGLELELTLTLQQVRATG